MIHRESKTFDRRGQATSWAAAKEKEFGDSDETPHRPEKNLRGPLRDVLAKYRKEVSEIRPMGRSKTAHIKFLEKSRIARIDTLDIRPSDLIEHSRSRRRSGAGPSTVNNDIIWLRVILRYARAAWDIPFDLAVIDDAHQVLKAEKLVSKSRIRSRRPTESEIEALTDYFEKRDRRQSNIPMKDIMWFAIHSARRQSEITNLLFTDNDEKTQTGIVRNIKLPTDREGFRRFKYTPQAWEIILKQRDKSDRIFPCEPKSIGSAFTRACHILEISDLRFHDLRHEATSRLFEAGYSIVEVQQFTLHDSWGTLSRYTHLRPETLAIRAGKT